MVFNDLFFDSDISSTREPFQSPFQITLKSVILSFLNFVT